MKPALILSVLAAATLAACAHSHGRSGSAQPDHAAAEASIQAVASKYGFNETVSRIEKAVKAKGMTVFAVIDHQAAAKTHGLTMQPAKVIVFGTPKAGTPLMVKDPHFALQLPLRVLVTENNGKTEAVFNDTRTLIRGSRIGYGEVENTLANAEKLIRATVSQ